MSGNECLLDTNVVIGLLKGYPPAQVLMEQRAASRLAISQITRMELLGYPKMASDEEKVIRAFLSTCRVVLLDERIEE